MMNDTIRGISQEFTVLGQIAATADDLTILASFIGSEVLPDEVAVVEAVAFDDSKNANGWKIDDLSKVETLGASLTYDHSTAAKDSFGVVFAETVEACNAGKQKRVKAAIPKSAKNQDVLTDIRYRVASHTSPMIKVSKWADEKNQVIAEGRMVHLSLVQNPAFGESNKVLSLAASNEEELLTAALFDLGKKVHGENVTRLVRLQERRAGGYSKEKREEVSASYLSTKPDIISDMLVLAEAANKPVGTSQQSVVISETPGSVSPKSCPPVYPIYSNDQKKE